MARTHDHSAASKSAKTLRLKIDIYTLDFTAYACTGVDPLTRPGVDVHLEIDDLTKQLPPLRRVDPDKTVRYWLPMSVLDRTQVRALRDFLTEFCLDFPEEERM
jgi:hypothetical protein